MEQERRWEELERLLRKEGLRELLVRYRDAMNEDKWTEGTAGELFTEDAVFVPPIGPETKGCPGIADAHRKMAEPFQSVLHSFSDQAVEPVGEMTESQRAVVRFQMVVFHQFPPEKAAHMAGDLFIVKDQAEGEAVLKEGRWKFCRLQMRTVYKTMAVEQGPGGPH